MTALRVLVDEKLAERASVLGEKFRSAVRAINSPLVQTVRGRGLLNAMVMNEGKSPRGRTAWQFCLLLKSRGLLAKPTHVNVCVFFCNEVVLRAYVAIHSVRFAPPLVISEEDLMKAVKIIEGCLADLDKVSRVLLRSFPC
jgi:ornithine--oxo-acid transaminase